eukprot:TRINITY_DN6781_c0_g1_i4.p1 TRINITY_DN6781_c0_g1~~TRINITY_DN6781_c0_g1_i4.p1  ORF type:complete len:222 (+),score=37.90 TRINITY_DN6781_c0_g1_i4:230-895(+)
MNCQKPNSECSGKKVFPCAYPACIQVFKTKFSCKRHQLVHTKEKPFSCEMCGRRFGLLQHLKEHSYRHFRQKPYACGIGECQETFRHASELSIHRRTHPQYSLKKYHYAKEVPAKIEKGEVKSETVDNGVDSMESGVRIEAQSALGQKELGDETFGLDLHYLRYLTTIDIPRAQRSRPVLPMPAVYCLEKRETGCCDDKHVSNLELINYGISSLFNSGLLN